MGLLAKIRRMHFRDRLGLREIARQTDLSRNTLRSWLRRPEVTEPKYPPRKSPGVIDPWGTRCGNGSRRMSTAPSVRNAMRVSDGTMTLDSTADVEYLEIVRTAMDWLAAFSTTALFAFVLWLSRNLILTRLTRSVQHEFDIKLAKLQGELWKSEKLFKADLRSKENQITALSSGALAGMTSRQDVLNKRRLEAVDQLWAAVTALGNAKMIVASMASIKFEAAAKEAANNPKAREVFAAIANNFDPQSIVSGDAPKARPYVSQMAWALFSAYQAILSLSVTQLQILKNGIDIPDLFNVKSVTDLIKAALPHRAEYIDQYGGVSGYYLLDELEALLLAELRIMLEGREADQANVEQAATILKASEKLMVDLKEAAPALEGKAQNPQGAD